MAGYIGIGGKAKKIKGIYFGVGNVAKKVKKAYIGVGGKAKLWYTSGPPIVRLDQTLTEIPSNGYKAICAKAGNYVWFHRGYKGYKYGMVRFDSNLTSNITNNWNFCCSVSLPTHCIFTNGSGGSDYTVTLNTNGGQVSSPTFGSGSFYRHYMCGTGTYLVTANSGRVKWLNDSLSWGTDVTNLPSTCVFTKTFEGDDDYPTPITFNNCALFGGGEGNTAVTKVDNSMTVSSITNLASGLFSNSGYSVGGYGVSASSSNSYVIFSPGVVNTVVDASKLFTAYNTSFTRQSTLYSPYNDYWYGQVGITGGKDYVMFSGGRQKSESAALSALTYIYDSSLTYQKLDDLVAGTSFSYLYQGTSAEHGQFFANKYYIFGGGASPNFSTYIGRMNVYQLT